jgi:hypothetical protein
MSRTRSLALVFALLVLLTTAFGARAPVARAEPPSGAEAVIAWNVIARRAAFAVAAQPVPHVQVSLAYVHAAVYDAVVAIEGGYQPYAVKLGPNPNASVPAAVAAAAHTVLVHYFPAQQAALDADYTAALAAIANGTSKVDGIAIGQAAAAALLARRQGDGLGVDIGFTMPAPAIGVWQLPTGQNPQTPWMSRLRPFLIERPDQFRAGPPPALDSAAYAADYAEVKAYGGSVSALRTAEQTDAARFWSAHPIVQNNIAYQDLARAHGFNAVQTARLYAMGNLVGADASIACFDAKYHYLFWRPQFAIPAGEGDGNPATVGDPAWTPLVATPPHSEYPSGHGCNNGSQAEVYAAVLGTSRIEVDITSTTAGLMRPTRHFARVNDLVQEIQNVRIWSGLHYRSSAEAGVNTGRKVVHFALKRYFLPTR